MYKIYLNPFDTGSMEQWLKLLMKFVLLIIRNGLMAGPACGEALQLFNKEGEKLENQTNAHYAKGLST